MNYRMIAAGAALAAGLFAAETASAAPIAYTFSANATGTVNGVAFANQPYSIVAIGDSTATTDGGFDNVFISATITIAGTACSSGCAFTAPATYRFSSNISGGTVTGVEPVAGSPPYGPEGFFASNYNLAVPTALVTATATNGGAPYVTFATSAGPVQITSHDTNPSFSSAFVNIVPTLSEWAMILMGLLLAGAGAVWTGRRRLA